MKTYLSHMGSKVSFWNLFIGIIVGAGLGLALFSALVPSGLDMIKVYHMQTYQQYQQEAKNNTMTGMDYIPNAMNPYMMKKITSEKQFVQEMIMHHDAAVQMAREVLLLNPRPEVKKLANDIIVAQTTEIKTMQGWLANWK